MGKPITEYWVMRVLYHNGRQLAMDSQMTTAAYLSVSALVATGDLCLLPDNTLAEPVECCRSEEEAHELRQKMRHDNPGVDFRVVLNASV
jgi:hypothetical protein